MSDSSKTANDWTFVHSEAAAAEWKPGLREIFDYRDLGIEAATRGDYVAHIIRANGRKSEDKVQKWHLHDCTFQMVYVLNGWATFEYEGQGVRTIRKGDAILQTPRLKHREIACSEDMELLEIVAPADFKTITFEDEEVSAAE
ncbi:MAG TPA: cupin domain-containing protein [Kiloniellales bacterium]|nr:cupin domain-containing protein [Kiloniellales bacterium]